MWPRITALLSNAFFFKNNIKMENYQKVDVMKEILTYLRARLRGVEYGRTT
jgi:hypothetical protein